MMMMITKNIRVVYNIAIACALYDFLLPGKNITWSVGRPSFGGGGVWKILCRLSERDEWARWLDGVRARRSERESDPSASEQCVCARVGGGGGGDSRYAGRARGRPVGGGREESKDAGRPPPHDIPTLRPTRSHPTTHARIEEKKSGRRRARTRQTRTATPSHTGSR